MQATQQAALAFPVPPVFDSAMLERIMKLGVGQADAENYLLTTDDGTLEATLAMVEKRVGSSAKTRIDSPAAYFRQALKNGYASGEAVAIEAVSIREKQVDPNLETPEQLRQRYLAARAKEAYALYLEMDDLEQQRWQASFKQDRKSGRAGGVANMSSALFRNEFSHWFAQQQWKEPAADDIIGFAIAYPKSAGGSDVV